MLEKYVYSQQGHVIGNCEIGMQLDVLGNVAVVLIIYIARMYNFTINICKPCGSMNNTVQ